MHDHLDYQRIKYFLAAAKTLNFSEAARQMYISPQGFGRQISLFEEEIGAQLFDRSKYKKKLTYEGELVYHHLSKAVDMLEHEYHMMQSMARKRKSQANIGILSFLNRTTVVSPVINELLAGSPERNINFRMCELNDLHKEVANGELDIGITVSTEPDLYESCNLGSRIISSHPLALVVSLYHDFVVKDFVTAEDLKNYDQVCLRFDEIRKNDFYNNIPCRSCIKSDNYSSLISQLSLGSCFSIQVPELEDLYEGYNLTTVPCKDISGTMNLMLIYQPNRMTPLLENLSKQIMEVLTKEV
ncbi:MAG: LysR family transcriptional regulator [Eubacterium sp.]|nr:LysR family transcriptional regulator [Eubacterium sp.]